MLQKIIWLPLLLQACFGVNSVFAQVRQDGAPCFQSSLTERDLANLLNLRPSADLTVLLNLPFGTVFCSPTKYRFIVIGSYDKRHQLSLNVSQPFFADSSSAAFSDDPAFLVKDVSLASESRHFDYLIKESDGLLEGNEYFVALTGCSSPMRCRTVGLAKFTSVKQRVGDVDSVVNLVIAIAAPIGCVFIIVVVASGLVWLFCCRRGMLMGKTGPRPNESGNSQTTQFQSQDHESNIQQQRAASAAKMVQMGTIAHDHRHRGRLQPTWTSSTSSSESEGSSSYK